MKIIIIIFYIRFYYIFEFSN